MNMKSTHLIGIDEVGRGPIAGPVAVGAFCFSISATSRVRRLFKGVKESKQLSEEKRESWFRVIRTAKKEGLVDFCVTFQSEKVIDGKGLSYSIRTALRRSIHMLNVVPKCATVLLDGGLRAPVEFRNQKTIIKGDEKELVIALASICAKVLRDRKMVALGKKHPQYGFEIHKGYGTKKHYGAIRRYGMHKAHRRSFLKRMM